MTSFAVKQRFCAARLHPGYLLHHIVRHFEDDDELLESIREAGFDGDVVVAKNLDRF